MTKRIRGIIFVPAPSRFREGVWPRLKREDAQRKDAAVMPYKWKMPPYDPHASCPKCGDRRVSSKHVVIAPVVGGGDVIRRECGRCSYRWDEAPRDAEGEDA